MTYFQGFLVALHILGIISMITSIGEPRKPYTSGLVAVSTILNLMIIYGLFFWL